jgi:hypothetical protein
MRSSVRGEAFAGKNAVRLGKNPYPDRIPLWKKSVKTIARTEPPDMVKVVEIFAGYMYKSVPIRQGGQDKLLHYDQARSRR